VTVVDSFLAEAGWVFFALWGVAVAAISLAAFGRDFLPSQPRVELPGEAHPIDPGHARSSSLR